MCIIEKHCGYRRPLGQKDTGANDMSVGFWKVHLQGLDPDFFPV